jgi:hypothetical protein
MEVAQRAANIGWREEVLVPACTELQAALANFGLERFPEQARQREEMATYMDEALNEVPGIRVLRPDWPPLPSTTNLGIASSKYATRE